MTGSPIPSTMMAQPLLISSVIDHAARWHRRARVVSRCGGMSVRQSYPEIRDRAKAIAAAAAALGLQPGERAATLAVNHHRHLELYYALSSSGFVCHTINPRLNPTQIGYMIGHARDRLLFVDPAFLPIVTGMTDRLGAVAGVIVLCAADEMPSASLPVPLLCYEELVDAHLGDADWPALDESAAAVLCYTSGTTGDPKGVLYSHRSSVLHAMAQCMPDAQAISATDTVCPVVPMFHVSAWGMPYAAPLVGAGLVLPGAALDGRSLFELFEAEGVTIALGVPTVWAGLLAFLRSGGSRFTTLNRIAVGGAAMPAALIRAFEDEVGIKVNHAWGMTETSPLGTIATRAGGMELDREGEVAIKAKQGRPIFGVDLRLEAADGTEAPHDGLSRGELLIRGPWVAGSYFDAPSAMDAFTADGWFRTGDISIIDADGFMQIVDRAKDLVKSGGEWISSIELENAAAGHPAVFEAAVIAVPDPKWQERPLLLVVAKPNVQVNAEDIRRVMAQTCAKWAVPDQVLFVDELPHGATGKVDKRQLRETFGSEQTVTGAGHRPAPVSSTT